jgi:hypothetical protein
MRTGERRVEIPLFIVIGLKSQGGFPEVKPARFDVERIPVRHVNGEHILALMLAELNESRRASSRCELPSRDTILSDHGELWTFGKDRVIFLISSLGWSHYDCQAAYEHSQGREFVVEPRLRNKTGTGRR